MDHDYIICKCGNKFKKKIFKKHYKNCQSFINKFNKFDFYISNLLKEYLFDKDNLLLIEFMMKRYIKLIEKKIKEYNNGIYTKNLDKKLGETINETPVCNTLSDNTNSDKFEKELFDCTNNINDFINIDKIDNNCNVPKRDNSYTPMDDNSLNPKNSNYFTPNPNIDIVQNNDNNNNNYENNNYNNNENDQNYKNDYNENDDENNNENNNNENDVIDYLLDFGKNMTSLFLNLNNNSIQEQLYNNN